MSLYKKCLLSFPNDVCAQSHLTSLPSFSMLSVLQIVTSNQLQFKPEKEKEKVDMSAWREGERESMYVCVCA